MFNRWLIGAAIYCLLSGALYAADSFVVSDIKLQGLERITDGTLLNYLPVQVGDTFDPNQAAHAIRQLYKTGFFKDVNLARDGDVLIVQVKERPAINNVTFSGNSVIEDEQLEEVLKDIEIVKGRVFNRSSLEKIEQGLTQQVYYSHGKYAVRIETKVTELERNRVDIDIKISEGVVAHIKQVNIVGNHVFDDDKLLDELQLGVPGFFEIFSDSDEYAKPKLSADLETLKSYYQDRGYIRFNIDSTQVTITPDKKDIYININVTEGEQYAVDAVKLAGDLVVDEAQLRALILVKQGDLFSRKTMTDGQDLLEKRLGNEGYAFAKVQIIPEIDDANKKVNLTYFVDPGKKVYVRRINFIGNYATNDEVLRRELRLMEGSELNNSKLERSKIRLQRLAYIEEVEIEKRPVAGTDDMIDIDINVTERLSGSFNIGAGFSQNQGFVFNMGLQMENILGSGNGLSLSFNNDKANTIYSASYTNPYYTIDGISRTIAFSYRQRDASEQDISNYLSNSYGANISYGVPLTEYDSVTFGLGIEHTDIIRSFNSTDEIIDFLNIYGDGATDMFGYKEAGFDALTFVVSYSHDTRNRTVFANKGSSQSVVLDFTAPGSDNEFYKFTYRTKFYFPVYNDITLLLNTDIAFGDGYGDTDGLPFYERFYAGGLRTVRGFDSNSLGPRATITSTAFDLNGQALIDPLTNQVYTTSTTVPRGGDLRTVAGAELIFPIPFVEKAPRSVRLSAFYDIGNVFIRDEADFSKDELRSSAGVSFVWLAPIGPLRFSWSRPIVEKAGDDTQNFQFSIGSFF
ncbi:MAG: outer membrane protein assembly factor BamA [Gammaproteobacteria bacterium]|nr:outer membrane protein assembly factor BamA [Gammaproteobacteria bacterium]MDH5734714.1 outer membrane protein assembly factor BamA [Gammaproteobacteria bacterium]